MGEARLLLARQEINTILNRLVDDDEVEAHTFDKFLVDLELECVHRRAEIE
jgi:hypothetical protein